MKVFFRIFNYLEELIIFLGMTAMVILNFANVFCRFCLPSFAFSWSETINIVLLVWVSMFGIALGYKRKAHSCVTFIVDKLPIYLRKLFIIIATICTLVFLFIAIYEGILMVQNQLQFKQYLTGMTISAAFGGLSIPIGCSIIALRTVLSSYRDFISLNRHEKEA